MFRRVQPYRAHVEPHAAQLLRIRGPGAAADAVGGFQHDGGQTVFAQRRRGAQAGKSGANHQDIGVGRRVGHRGSSGGRRRQGPRARRRRQVGPPPLLCSRWPLDPPRGYGRAWQTTIAADVAIIGAGPVGLFAVFELGMLKLSSVLIDALGEVGGQCAALYPEKPIYDIPAHPAIEAGELVAQLERQIAPFHAPRLLGRRVSGLAGGAGAFTLSTTLGDTVRAKAVIVAAGAGAFGPNRPPIDGLAEYEATGAVQYYVRRREDFRGKRVMIAGGGDSAVDWALALKDVARVAVVHRRREIPRRAGKCRAARRRGGTRRDRDGHPLSAPGAARRRRGADGG